MAAVPFPIVSVRCSDTMLTDRCVTDSRYALLALAEGRQQGASGLLKVISRSAN